jgi:hypothetical protein
MRVERPLTLGLLRGIAHSPRLAGATAPHITRAASSWPGGPCCLATT